MGTAVTKIHAAAQSEVGVTSVFIFGYWFRISVESLRVACETLAVKPLVSLL